MTAVVLSVSYIFKPVAVANVLVTKLKILNN